MIPRTRLLFAGTDDAARAVCLDWLTDEALDSVPAKDVLPSLLMAFAGEPPDFGGAYAEDVYLWRLLAGWCERIEPERELPPDMLIDQGRGPLRFRWEAVAACEVNWEVALTEARIRMTVSRIPPGQRQEVCRQMLEAAAAQATEGSPVRKAGPRARREWKRRVLSLFPEVTLTRTFRGTDLHQRNVLEEVPSSRYDRFPIDYCCEAIDFTLDGVTIRATPERRCTIRRDEKAGCFVLTQEVPAPEWIPPESPPGSGWGHTTSTPAEDLQTVREAILSANQRLAERFGR